VTAASQSYVDAFKAKLQFNNAFVAEFQHDMSFPCSEDMRRFANRKFKAKDV
jgi:hypothetical protein